MCQTTWSGRDVCDVEGGGDDDDKLIPNHGNGEEEGEEEPGEKLSGQKFKFSCHHDKHHKRIHNQQLARGKF